MKQTYSQTAVLQSRITVITHSTLETEIVPHTGHWALSKLCQWFFDITMSLEIHVTYYLRLMFMCLHSKHSSSRLFLLWACAVSRFYMVDGILQLTAASTVHFLRKWNNVTYIRLNPCHYECKQKEWKTSLGRAVVHTHCLRRVRSV